MKLAPVLSPSFYAELGSSPKGAPPSYCVAVTWGSSLKLESNLAERPTCGTHGPRVPQAGSSPNSPFLQFHRHRYQHPPPPLHQFQQLQPTQTTTICHETSLQCLLTSRHCQLLLLQLPLPLPPAPTHHQHQNPDAPPARTALLPPMQISRRAPITASNAKGASTVSSSAV